MTTPYLKWSLATPVKGVRHGVSASRETLTAQSSASLGFCFLSSPALGGAQCPQGDVPGNRTWVSFLGSPPQEGVSES